MLGGCLHILVLWLAVQAVIISEAIQRQSNIDMQLDTLTSLQYLGACAHVCMACVKEYPESTDHRGLYKVGLQNHVFPLCTDFNDMEDYNSFMLAYLDKLVGWEHVWRTILKNDTMVTPWEVPYYLGDLTDGIVTQQLYGPRNMTCVLV